MRIRLRPPETMCKNAMILAVSMAASASAFQLGAPTAAPMALRSQALCSARHSQFIGAPALRQAPAVRARSSTDLKMSLFGLGVPELAVIGVLAVSFHSLCSLCDARALWSPWGRPGVPARRPGQGIYSDMWFVTTSRP